MCVCVSQCVRLQGAVVCVCVCVSLCVREQGAVVCVFFPQCVREPGCAASGAEPTERRNGTGEVPSFKKM